MRSALIILLVCLASTFAAPTQQDERIVNAVLTQLGPYVSTIIGHVQAGNIGGIISTVLGAAHYIGKRSAEDQKIIDMLTSHVTEILSHGQVLFANLASQLLTSIMTSPALGGGKRQIGQFVGTVASCYAANGGNLQAQIACVLATGKRSAEDIRIINTITSAFGNIWGSLTTIAAPHVDNLVNELMSHAGNIGQSLVGTIAAITGAVSGKRQSIINQVQTAIQLISAGNFQGLISHVLNVAGPIIQGRRNAEDVRIINTITTAFGNVWGSLTSIAAPHVDNLVAEMIGHLGGISQSIVGTMSGITGAVGGY